jgi:hypothetical protein
MQTELVKVRQHESFPQHSRTQAAGGLIWWPKSICECATELLLSTFARGAPLTGCDGRGDVTRLAGRGSLRLRSRRRRYTRRSTARHSRGISLSQGRVLYRGGRKVIFWLVVFLWKTMELIVNKADETIGLVPNPEFMKSNTRSSRFSQCLKYHTTKSGPRAKSCLCISGPCLSYASFIA